MPIVEDNTRLDFPSVGSTTVGLCEPAALVCCAAAGPGGHALRVLIDTGTDPSAIDTRLARRLALPTGGSGMGQGAASDAVPFTEAVLPWLRIGDLTIRDLLAPALDLSFLPFHVDVVLGYNVLRQLSMRIGYRERTLTLAHPDLGAPDARGVSLPLTFFEHFPALTGLDVEGISVPIATIDTGSNGALTLGPDLAAALGLAPGAAGVTLAHGAGFGGDSRVVRRPGRTVQIGPLTLGDVELDAHLGGGGDFGRTGRANIGNRLLSRFDAVTLDYERRTIAFE